MIAGNACSKKVCLGTIIDGSSLCWYTVFIKIVSKILCMLSIIKQMLSVWGFEFIAENEEGQEEFKIGSIWKIEKKTLKISKNK